MTPSVASKTSPASLGYRMPAEWEPHQATWLTWPRREGISFPDRYESIPEYWAKISKLLSPGEEVHINVFDEAYEAEADRLLRRAGLVPGKRVFLHRFPSYEPWCRDHGPIFVVTSPARTPSTPPLAIVDWGYNAWGNKYPPYELDDRIPFLIAGYLGIPLYQPGIIMEGGSLDVNGKGTLLTTESCLLNANRNPHLTRPQIESFLREFLGVSHILWLKDGIVGDDTDGHIDDITRFVDAQTLVTAIEEDPCDENYKPLQENLKLLEQMKDQDGNRFRIVPLPMPGVVEYQGQRLPASYVNFYIANEVVLLPIYNHAHDRLAQETLQKLFPTRKVEPIDCRELIWGLGAFHCITQQQPLSPSQ